MSGPQVIWDEQPKPPPASATAPPQVQWDDEAPKSPVPYAKPGPYTTSLPPDQERGFQSWVKQNKVPWQDTPNADYDMRGYYKAQQSGDANAQQKQSGFDGQMHFPDTYKTPYHKTFSNESMYATPDAPHWQGDRLVDKSGKVIADETPQPIVKPAPVQVTPPAPIGLNTGTDMLGDTDPRPAPRAAVDTLGNPIIQRPRPEPIIDPVTHYPIAKIKAAQAKADLVAQGKAVYTPEEQEILKAVNAGQQAQQQGLEAIQKYAVTPFEKMSQAGAKAGAASAEAAVSTGKTVGTPARGQVRVTPTTPAPAITGIARATGSVIGGVAADPRMWPLFFMGPEASTAKTVMSAGFGTQMAVGAYQQAGELGKIMDNPDVPQEDKWEAGANMVLSTLMAAQAYGHPVTGAVKARLEEFQRLPAEDQAQIRNRLRQKAPEVADAVDKAAQQTQETPKVTWDDETKAKPERFRLPRGTSAQEVQGPVKGPNIRTVQVGDKTYAFDQRKINADGVTRAAERNELWRLSGGKAPEAAKVQAEHDVRGEEPEVKPEAHAAQEVKWDDEPTDNTGLRRGELPERFKPINLEKSIQELQAPTAQPVQALDNEAAVVPPEPQPSDRYAEARRLAMDFGKASTSLLQRRLKIGFKEAESYVNRMVDDGTAERGETGVPHIVKFEPPPEEPSAQPERRTNVAERKRVEQMTPEERAHELLTSPKTGLPNDRAFEEDSHALAESHPHVGYADIDDFKRYNDALGHEGVDKAVLPAIGDVFKDAAAKEPDGSVKVYHRSGDEFNFRATTPEAIKRVTDRVNRELAETTFKYETKDGRILEKKGTGLSHGIGTDHESAEENSHADKVARKAAGLREGGRDVPAVDTSGATGIEAPVRDNTERERVPGKEEAREDLAAQAAQAHNAGDTEGANKALKELVRERLGTSKNQVTVTVQGEPRSVTLSDEQMREWNSAKKDYEQRVAFHKRNNDIQNDPIQLAANLKGAGMEYAAEKRRITGELTPTEAKNKASREASNYRGKPVSVKGQNGTVVGMSFGKVRVKLESGETISALVEDIQTPQERKEADSRLASENEQKPQAYGSKNTVFTADKRDAALARLKSKIGRLHSGIDPEVVKDLIDIGGYHFEAGLHEFGDWAKKVAEDVGDWAKPYLKAIHEEIANQLGGSKIETEQGHETGQPTGREGRPEVQGAGGESGHTPEHPSPEAVRGTEAERETQEPSGIERATGVEQREPVSRAGAAPEPGGGTGARPSTATERGAGRGRRQRPSGADGKPVEAESPRGPAEAIPEQHTREQSKNYRYANPEEVGKGGEMSKIDQNISAIRVLKELTEQGRHATPEEQEILAKYTGWGGLSGIFNHSYERQYRERYNDLTDLIDHEQLRGIQRSTINAHYTSPEVIDFMWKLAKKMGFEGGRIIEPGMGVGYFFGLMPEEMRNHPDTKLLGVELDPITGRIAQELYQGAKILNTGYEKVQIPDNSLDFAVGNVPFANVTPFDPRYNKLSPRPSLHDYYFLKTLDKVRPGGIVSFITSRYTMDKVDSRIREMMADRADLVAAYRLPNTAFKGVAATKVTADLLVLRKRAGDEIRGGEPFRDIVPHKEGIKINQYFQQHPENMFGTMEADEGNSPGELGLKPNGEINDHLTRALDKAPKDVYGQQAAGLDTPSAADPTERAPDNIKEGQFYLQDGSVKMKRQGVPVDLPVPHSVFDLVPVSDEYQQKTINKELESAREALKDYQANSAMPIPALISSAAGLVKKGTDWYHGKVDDLLDWAHMGQTRPEIRKFDDAAADLATKMDAGGQYHKAVAEMIGKQVTGPLTEAFDKADNYAARQKKNEVSRDRMKGFHFLADAQNREWLEANHPEGFHRWSADPKIKEALDAYKPFEDQLRSAVKQLGGKTIDEDYIKRIMDFATSGVAYEKGLPHGVEGPVELRQGAAAGRGGGRDNVVSPQIDRSKSRKDQGQYYWDHGVFDFGPSFEKRWVEVQSKLDEHRLAVHSMSMGTRIMPDEEAPEKVFYNGQEFYRPDIAKEIRDVQKRGVSAESKDLADALGVSELPTPKNVREYANYEPLRRGSRFETAARNLAADVLAGKEGLEGQAANVNRMAKMRYALPKEIVEALNDAGREKELGALSKKISQVIGPLTQFIRQQIVGLAYGVPHMANILRKVVQAQPGGALSPMAWANAFKVAFSKDLKARGIAGPGDPGFDRLLRNAAINEGAIPQYKHYIEGNFDPRSWEGIQEAARTTGNAFRKGGKEGAGVTPLSAAAGLGRLAIEPLNRFSEAGHRNLFKPGGIDQRARIWLGDFLKDRYPGMGEQRIAHEVNQTLGRYNRASWTDVQRNLGPLMLFPGWDYSSMAFALKHPFKTAVAPAILMLLANAAVHAIGGNKNDEKNDLERIHVGKYSIRTNLFNDNMGTHLWGWALRGGKAVLDHKNAKETTGEIVKGIPGDVAGVTTGTMNPILSTPIQVGADRVRPGGGPEIAPRKDFKKKGRILPNKAAEDYGDFALRRMFPIYDRATQAGQRPSLASFAGLAGVSVTEKKKKK